MEYFHKQPIGSAFLGISHYKASFEEILGYEMSMDEFKDIYINALFCPMHNTLKSGLNRMKQQYLKSEGKLPLACSYLYQKYPDLNNFTFDEDVEAIAEKLERDGYATIPNFLSDEQVEAMRPEVDSFDFFDPCDLDSGGGSQKFSDLKKKQNDPTPVYSSYLADHTIKEDSNLGVYLRREYFAKISARYFRSNPYLCDAVYLYSNPKSHSDFSLYELKNSAQTFHFDYSNFRFLKFFLYMTDVSSVEKGAHVFAKKTHDKDFKYPKDTSGFLSHHTHENGCVEGQVKNSFVESCVGKDNVIHHTYPKGSLIIENTAALHRGGEVLEGNREVLQVTYVIGCFGANPPPRRPCIQLSAENDKPYLSPVSSNHRAQNYNVWRLANKVSFSDKIKHQVSRVKRVVGRVLG